MTRFSCIVILVAFSIIATSAIDCKNNPCTSSGRQHTLCLYPKPDPAASCGKVLSVGLTDDEKNELVSSHNDHRSFVAQGLEKRGKPGPQPPASNMQTMTWDDELADIAQRWANQCHFGHDQCRDVDRYYVGQNAGVTMTSGKVTSKPSNITDLWYNEVKDLNRNQVSKFTNTVGVGHYTQLVWANSNKVGCGKIVYQADSWKRYYIVCNYGPGGNIINQPIYLIKK